MEQATLRYAEELQQKKNHFFWPSLWKKAYFWLLIYYKGEVNHSGLQVTNYRPIFSQKIKLDKVGIINTMKCSKDQWTEMLSKFGASHVFATLKRLAP